MIYLELKFILIKTECSASKPARIEHYSSEDHEARRLMLCVNTVSHDLGCSCRFLPLSYTYLEYALSLVFRSHHLLLASPDILLLLINFLLIYHNTLTSVIETACQRVVTFV